MNKKKNFESENEEKSLFNDCGEILANDGCVRSSGGKNWANELIIISIITDEYGLESLDHSSEFIQPL